MADNDITLLSGNPFIKLYEVYNNGDKTYVCASRRNQDRMPAAMDDDQRKSMLPDAVSIFVIIKVEGEEPQLLLNWEFRYPAGAYLLSVPAGLIDPEDRCRPDALEATTIRELGEECGLELQNSDNIRVLNPAVWSTPGLTDETNALMEVVLNRAQMPQFNQSGAEGTEDFDGVCLLTKAQAQAILQSGRDPKGNFYPLFTWAALMHFLTV